MLFDELHRDISFSCIGEDTPENTEDYFFRRLDKNELRDKDFETYWEKGWRPDPGTKWERKNVCSRKGVSCYLYNGNDEEMEKKLIATLGEKAKFKRKLGKFLCKLRFKRSAGKIWKNGMDSPYHCDFYKSDDFTLEKVDIIDIRPLENKR